MESSGIFTADWGLFIGRLFLTIGVLTIISRFFYYGRGRGSREYLFTYMGTGTILYVVCFLISRVELNLGFAIGLFAVFSLIRYRSLSARPRELAYLFICLGLSLAIAMLPHQIPVLRTMINLSVILIFLGLLEFLVFRGSGGVRKEIIYDRLDLLGEENERELVEDLETRFGLKGIQKVRVGDIDTLKSKVKLRIYLQDPGRRHFQE